MVEEVLICYTTFPSTIREKHRLISGTQGEEIMFFFIHSIFLHHSIVCAIWEKKEREAIGTHRSQHSIYKFTHTVVWKYWENNLIARGLRTRFKCHKSNRLTLKWLIALLFNWKKKRREESLFVVVFVLFWIFISKGKTCAVFWKKDKIVPRELLYGDLLKLQSIASKGCKLAINTQIYLEQSFHPLVICSHEINICEPELK